MRRALALSTLVLVSACAYYNGLYNARGLVRRAESAAREGRDTAAITAWREAASKADTVVRRYPRSRWTDDALFLSGTSSALAGDCTRGLERLAQWQSHPGADTRQRARVTLARGVCLVRLGEHGRALDSLAPLVADGDLSRNGLLRAVEHDGDLYVIDMRRSTVRRLTDTRDRESSPKFDASGQRVFFLRGDNAFAIELVVLVRLDAELLPCTRPATPALCHAGQPGLAAGVGPVGEHVVDLGVRPFGRAEVAALRDPLPLPGTPRPASPVLRG